MKAYGLAAVILLALMASGQAPAQRPTTVTFFWHAGDRAELLRRMAREYTRQTGVEIKAILPPLTDEYHQWIAEEFARKGSAFDLCMFDSQSMAEFASQGHIVLLNDRLKTSDRVRASDFDPAALRRYAEYPEGSGNLYALPVNQDCMGLVYRRDLFEDPQEKAAFRQKYGYDLAVPQTYDQLRDIAEFFTRPAANLHGIALYGSENYDACTSVFNNILWSFGGELWEGPRTAKVQGYLNSPQAVRALEFYRRLFASAPAGFGNAYVPEVNKALAEGRVALGFQWYYYFDELAAQTAGTTHKLGFDALPGQGGSDGVLRRFVMVGGQGVSISRYSQHQDEAWKFLEWFMSPAQQWRWVQGGGKSGLAAILKDPKFLEASPANRSFALSMSLTKDYWHLPAYPRLLRIYQHYVHQAITGELPAQKALDLCAQEHEEILKASSSPAGPIRVPERR
jgi:multiple sugar transport system substrate-binding protein